MLKWKFKRPAQFPVIIKHKAYQNLPIKRENELSVSPNEPYRDVEIEEYIWRSWSTVADQRKNDFPQSWNCDWPNILMA